MTYSQHALPYFAAGSPHLLRGSHLNVLLIWQTAVFLRDDATTWLGPHCINVYDQHCMAHMSAFAFVGTKFFALYMSSATRFSVALSQNVFFSVVAQWKFVC
jgi:hypothetical protein